MNNYSVKLLNNGLTVKGKPKKKSTYGGGYKLSNDELNKWAIILGPKKIITLHMDSKIRLTANQLDRMIKRKNDEMDIDIKNKPVTKDDFDRALDVIMAAMRINKQKDEKEN